MGIAGQKQALAMNHDFLMSTTTKSRIVPGAKELLEYLHPRYRLFILSNGFREVQYKKLCSAGLEGYFERLILSEDAQIQKPHKGIFEFALQQTHSLRAESLMIGDCWEADIVGAYNAQIDQIWLNPKACPPRLHTYLYRQVLSRNQANPLELTGEVELDFVEVLLRHHQHIAGIR